MTDKAFDRLLGERLQALRESQKLSLGELAGRSGVSKAMIARVERAESSATAALLGRLCAGLGVTLSSVIAQADRPAERLSRYSDQPIWRDPGTGYLRRQTSPPGAASGFEIVWVELPAGAQVPYRAWFADIYTQQLLMLKGRLHLRIGDDEMILREGDCIDFDVSRPVRFANKGRTPANYLIVLRKS
jgi:transcriptional regulator with XRE-family HTH domain